MSCEPRIFQNLSGSGPQGRVLLEDPVDEAPRALRDSATLAIVGRELVLARLDLPEQVALVLREERQLADDHDEEDDAARPDVGRLALVRLLLREVGAHVLGRAALHRQLLILRAARREPEINDLDVVVSLLVDQNIVELQVSVDDVEAVHVSHSADDLLENMSCLRLREPQQRLPLLQAVEEVLAVAELHDEMHMRPGVDDFVEAHYVRVAQVCQDEDFSMKRQLRVLLLQILLLIDLERDHVARLPVDAPLDNGEGALPNLQADLELGNFK